LCSARQTAACVRCHRAFATESQRPGNHTFGSVSHAETDIRDVGMRHADVGSLREDPSGPCGFDIAETIVQGAPDRR
jgi:hypothetical protein